MFTVWNFAGLPQVYAGPSPVAAAAAVGRAAPVGDGARSAPLARPDPYTRARQRLEEEPQQRHRVVAARELMSSPVEVLRPTATVAEAWALVRDRRFRHLPVVNDQARLIGILSDRDLLRIAGTPDAPPRPGLATVPVRDVMKTQVFSADPDTSIRAVARVMFDERIGSMPVVSADGEVLGILTRSDILRALVHEAPLEIWV